MLTTFLLYEKPDPVSTRGGALRALSHPHRNVIDDGLRSDRRSGYVLAVHELSDAQKIVCFAAGSSLDGVQNMDML